MNNAVRMVLEDTAMAAAGQGTILVSRLIHRAHAGSGWFPQGPVCVLVEADRARPGTAGHLASMPGITVRDLDFAPALAVARHPTRDPAHSHCVAPPAPPRTARPRHRHPAPAGGRAGPGMGPTR